MTTAQDQQSRAEPATFEAWWAEEGQFCRAGGGDYEKTFAHRAWQAARALPAGVEPVAWIEHDEGGVAYMPYYDAARKLPQRVKFDLFTAPQVLAMGRVPLSADEYQAKYAHIHTMNDDERYGYESCLDEMQLAAAPRPPAAQDMAGKGDSLEQMSKNNELRAQERKPLFWVRLLRDGMYEGPVHANSVGGKMMRDEKPDEWHPLYLGSNEATHGITGAGNVQ